MPISIKSDVKPAFKLGSTFSLRDTPLFTTAPGGKTTYFSTGSYLAAIRSQIADRNWLDFYNSWHIALPDVVQRDLTRAIASKFNLQGRADAYNELFKFVSDARSYEKHERDGIEKGLTDAYRYAARLAAGDTVDQPSFDRAPTTSASRIVVFSDMHMTAQDKLPSYFKTFNYDLYLDVLDYYAGEQFTLVENGDVEDCLVYDPTVDEARARTDAAPIILQPLPPPGQPPTGVYFDPQSGLPAGHFDLPVTASGPKWRAFMNRRYAKRQQNQDAIIATFKDYYDRVRTGFISGGRYYRLTGNHDTYLDQEHERDLRNRIEGELGVPVHDALRVSRGGLIKYLIMHGHQFDSVCLQAGDKPYAKSLGEMYTECTSWAFQGAERVWTLSDTQKWYYGGSISNVLAREKPGTYQGGGSGEWDLLWDDVARIKQQPKDFIETLLGHEVGWEYFENADGFEAFALEVWTGDEFYKLRSLDEVSLCLGYTNAFLDLHTPPDFSIPIPKLVVGHTHEPRQNAVFPSDPAEDEPWEKRDNHSGAYYLNSGSAGRHQNLIWCVEIVNDEDTIVSWSRIDGKLTRIAWRSDGDKLVHA